MDKLIEICKKYNINPVNKDIQCDAMGIGDILLRLLSTNIIFLSKIKLCPTILSANFNTLLNLFNTKLIFIPFNCNLSCVIL